MKTYRIHTISELRAAFWREHAQLPCARKPNGSPMPQNRQPTDTRIAFGEYVEALARSGDIGERLAQTATL